MNAYFERFNTFCISCYHWQYDFWPIYKFVGKWYKLIKTTQDWPRRLLDYLTYFITNEAIFFTVSNYLFIHSEISSSDLEVQRLSLIETSVRLSLCVSFSRKSKTSYIVIIRLIQQFWENFKLTAARSSADLMGTSIRLTVRNAAKFAV